VSQYTLNPRAKARLKEDIQFNNTSGGKSTFKAGTISDLLIDRGDGLFHFEANNEAIVVDKSEIEMI
jgi:hypothetical protein